MMAVQFLLVSANQKLIIHLGSKDKEFRHINR
jgi:hypothetical protein